MDGEIRGAEEGAGRDSVKRGGLLAERNCEHSCGATRVLNYR